MHTLKKKLEAIQVTYNTNATPSIDFTPKWITAFVNVIAANIVTVAFQMYDSHSPFKKNSRSSITDAITMFLWFHSSLSTFPHECLACNTKMLPKWVPKWSFIHFLYHWMTFYDYIIVDSCIISFNLNCIMQFKQFYDIATKVSLRKTCYYFW